GQRERRAGKGITRAPWHVNRQGRRDQPVGHFTHSGRQIRCCFRTLADKPNTRVDVATRLLSAAATLLFAAFTCGLFRALPRALGFARPLLLLCAFRGLLAAAASTGCFPAARLPGPRRLAGARSSGAPAAPSAAFALGLGGAGTDVTGVGHGGTGQVVVAHSHPVVEIVLHDRLAV